MWKSFRRVASFSEMMWYAIECSPLGGITYRKVAKEESRQLLASNGIPSNPKLLKLREIGVQFLECVASRYGREMPNGDLGAAVPAKHKRSIRKEGIVVRGRQPRADSMRYK